MDDIPRGTGDYVICYDIRGRDELLAVHGEIAPYTTMLQRSVYWLRGPATRLACLFARCAPYLAAGSELWAYPLRSAGALWRIGRHETAILPITTHRWREP